MVGFIDDGNDPVNSAKIRALNDQLRTTMTGGKVMLSAGIAAMDLLAQARVLAAVRTFDGFNAENDPWHEHDMGALDVDGNRIFFKHDYYDPTLSYLSDDPADPTKTARVLTIMLAHEY